MANLKKAYIKPVHGQNTDPIEVLFNPAEYSLEKGNQFQSNALPGLPSPLFQFVNGDADSLTMELFFDTYTLHGGKDVTEYTGKIARLMEMDPDLHAPPVVRFIWGPVDFKAIIEKLSQKFTMFLDDGTPVRATLGVTFKEYKTVEEQLTENRLNSADVRKRRLLARGESLWWLAYQEYRDPARWRDIARDNDIDHPLRLPVGTEITFPPVK